MVPALWLYEASNVAGLAVRKGRITEDKATAFLESLGDLPIEIENPGRTQMFLSVGLLMARYSLTAYDASYLELAIRHGLPIATFDKALPRAAAAAGAELVGL